LTTWKRHESRHLRHISLAAPLTIALNGRRSYGVVMKPVKPG